MVDSDRPSGVAPTQYDDFDVEIGRGSGREHPMRIRSNAGALTTTMIFPFDDLTLENRLQALQIALLRSGGMRRRLPSAEEAQVQALGAALFDALFTGDVRSLYDLSRRSAHQAGKGLRIKLHIEPPELAALPWEFLYDPRQGEYTVLTRSTPIVRTLDLPQPLEALTVDPPLRILGLVAAPADLPELAIKREKERIEHALAHLKARGWVELMWVEAPAPSQREPRTAHPTWRDLQRALRSGPWHIFHFVGHGGFDAVADEGVLALADEEGRTAPLRATQLGRLLADQRSLRLVLLNACASAQGSPHDVFSSTASILVQRNIPAVLAMQYEITDHAAIEFAQTFYEALAEGFTLSAAVAEARIALSLAVANSVEWGTPVLYMRGADGRLFDLQTQAPPARRVATQTRQHNNRVLFLRLFLATLALGLLIYLGLWHGAFTPSSPTATPSATATPVLRATATLPLPTAAGSTTDINALLRQGEDALANGQPQAALGFFQEALTLDAQHFGALSGVGRAYAKMGQPNQAVEYFKAALAVGPTHADTLYDLALTYNYQLRDHEAALITINQALALNPTAINYRVARGKINTFLGRRDDAEADFNAVIEREPNSWLHYADRAEFYTRSQEYDAALTDYTTAIGLAPVEAWLYYERAELYRLYKNDNASAQEDYRQYLARVNRERAEAEQIRQAEAFLQGAEEETEEMQPNEPISTTPILLYTSLDDIAAIEQPAIGIGGQSALQPVDFVAGRQGQSARFIGGEKYVVFPVTRDGRYNVNLAQGELEFWYKPQDNAGDEDDAPHVLIVMGEYYQPPRLMLVEGEWLSFSMQLPDDDKRHEVRTAWRAPLWQAEQWVHIRAAWNAASRDDALQIYVNEEQVDAGCTACGWNSEGVSIESITVGAANRAGHASANGVIDELIIRGLVDPSQ